MLLGLFLVLTCSNPVRINTYFPMPIGEEYFAVDSQNIGYFLDTKAKQVRVFDGAGNQINQFGRPGQGVGDLDLPRRLVLEGDRVIVLEGQFINEFKKDGTFVSKTRTPFGMHTFVEKFQGTIVAYDSKFKNPQQLKLQFYNSKFELYQETITFDWEHPLFRAGDDPSMSAITIVPAPQQNVLYIVFSKTFRVVIIDVEQRKVIQDIQLDLMPVAFNETWGEVEYQKSTAQWQQMQKRIGLGSTPNKPKAFPTHFPIIRDAYADLKGNVVISLWTHQPDKVFNLKALNPQGESVGLEYDHPDTYRRLMARRNGYVYLWDYHMQDEESYIVRVKEEQVNDFAKNNPLTFELVGQNFPQRN